MDNDTEILDALLQLKVVDADRPTPNTSKRKELSQIIHDLVPPKQGELFHVEKQRMGRMSKPRQLYRFYAQNNERKTWL